VCRLAPPDNAHPPEVDNPDMRWVFRRGAERLTYEARRLASGEWQVDITHPDGARDRLRLAAADLDEQQDRFKRQLTALGWQLEVEDREAEGS